MERQEKSESHRAPPFMEEVAEEMGRLSEIEGVSREEFASGLRAFEERLLALLELAPADAAGMCTMMRLAHIDAGAVEAMDRERARTGWRGGVR